MLKLYDIKKDYNLPDYSVHALKGVSINFRKSELVSILGPSGCGKTTLLNIVGGLDKYTSGDLIINSISTKEFKDRDWDTYRNHYVGFVFQSYNLIPHLNVLQNVELALTISGMSKSRRKQMAIAALEKVGLGEQLKKKPNQLSGGQCQRVAIARAIVTNPKIILADEPTGALDTETSEQIMELLQEISDDRLVIMVTHNPQLAQHYSTRIIELLDGTIISDSNPYDGMPTMIEPVKAIVPESKPNIKRERMICGLPASEFRKLSLKEQTQLRKDDAKKKRENRKKQATEFDHDKKPETALVESETQKFVAQITAPSPEKPIDPNAKRVKEKKAKTSMSFLTALSLSSRNLWTKKFRTSLISFAGSIGIIGIALVLSLTNGFNIYVDNLQTSTLVNMPVMISSMSISVDTSAIINSVNQPGDEYPDAQEVKPYSIKAETGIEISANILTENYIEYVKKVDMSLVNSIKYSYSFRPVMVTHDYRDKLRSANLYGTFSQSYWNELLDEDFMKSQYDVLYGRYPTNYNEIVLVVDQYNYISADILNSILGYELKFADDGISYKNIPFSDFVYHAETNPKTYTILTNNNRYYASTNDDGLDVFKTRTIEEAYAEPVEQNIELKVVGVIRPNKNVVIPFIPNGLAYTSELSKIYLDNCMNSEVAEAQRDNEDYNVLNGVDFASDFSSLITVLAAYGMTESQVVTTIKSLITLDTLKQLGTGKTDEELQQLINDIRSEDTLNGVMWAISDSLNLPPSLLKEFLIIMLSGIEELGISYDQLKEILDSGYKQALQRLGASTMPGTIYIYPKTFEAKDAVLTYLDHWNELCENEGNQIAKVKYTDMAGTVSKLTNYIINIVTWIFVAFAAISLVVSSIMIAIVTYISVLERTTEIGVLRSIGARKLDIANVFNAETFIIGTISGVLGIVIAWILDFVLNAVLHMISPQIPEGFAQLAWWHALVLIALSIVLNILAGFIPSIIASKKDPVVALRSNN